MKPRGRKKAKPQEEARAMPTVAAAVAPVPVVRTVDLAALTQRLGIRRNLNFSLPHNVSEPEQTFNWKDHLSLERYEYAPVSCFLHAPCREAVMSLTPGLRVEVCSTKVCTYWVAHIVKLHGYAARLRYEGVDNAARDILMHSCNGEMQPLKWSEKHGLTPMVPPALRVKYMRRTQTEWESFLESRTRAKKTLPADFDIKANRNMESRFLRGTVFECLDPIYRREARAAFVTDKRGKRVYIRYMGLEGGFWCHEDNDLLHHVGWASQVGVPITAPQAYNDRVAAILEGRADYQLNDTSPELFAMRYDYKQYDTNNCTSKFSVGMKFEIIEPWTLGVICPATVMAVLNYGYIMIRLDSYEPSAEDADWICVHEDSPSLLPIGFCEYNGIQIQPPLGYTEEQFEWAQYLEETGGIAAEPEFFNLDVPDHGFEPGMFLEAVHDLYVQMVGVAKVSRVAGRLLLIHFEGWDNSFDQWRDCHSLDIYPIGWAHLLNLRVDYPLGEVVPDQEPAFPDDNHNQAVSDEDSVEPSCSKKRKQKKAKKKKNKTAAVELPTGADNNEPTTSTKRSKKKKRNKKKKQDAAIGAVEATESTSSVDLNGLHPQEKAKVMLQAFKDAVLSSNTDLEDRNTSDKNTPKIKGKESNKKLVSKKKLDATVASHGAETATASGSEDPARNATQPRISSQQLSDAVNIAMAEVSVTDESLNNEQDILPIQKKYLNQNDIEMSASGSDEGLAYAFNAADKVASYTVDDTTFTILPKVVSAENDELPLMVDGVTEHENQPNLEPACSTSEQSHVCGESAPTLGPGYMALTDFLMERIVNFPDEEYGRGDLIKTIPDIAKDLAHTVHDDMAEVIASIGTTQILQDERANNELDTREVPTIVLPSSDLAEFESDPGAEPKEDLDWYEEVEAALDAEKQSHNSELSADIESHSGLEVSNVDPGCVNSQELLSDKNELDWYEEVEAALDADSQSHNSESSADIESDSGPEASNVDPACVNSQELLSDKDELDWYEEVEAALDADNQSHNSESSADIESDSGPEPSNVELVCVNSQELLSDKDELDWYEEAQAAHDVHKQSHNSDLTGDVESYNGSEPSNVEPGYVNSHSIPREKDELDWYTEVTAADDVQKKAHYSTSELSDEVEAEQSDTEPSCLDSEAVPYEKVELADVAPIVNQQFDYSASDYSVGDCSTEVEFNSEPAFGNNPTVPGDKVELALVDIAPDGDNRSHNSTSELIGEVESGAAPSITQPACGSNEEAGSSRESSGSVGSAISSSIADLSTEVEYNSEPDCGDHLTVSGDKVELALVDIAADGDNRSHNSTSELIGEVESGAAPSITQPACGSNEEAGSFGESSGSVGSAISSSIADLSTEVEYNSDPICGDNPSLTGDKVELALVDIAADGDNRSHNSTSELIGEVESGAAPSITQPTCGSNEEAGSFGESSGSVGSAISSSIADLSTEVEYNSDPICGDNPSLTGDKVELALVDIAADGDNRSHNSTSELIGEFESGAAPSITQPACGSNEEAGSSRESSGSVGSAISSSIADLSTEVEYNSEPDCGDHLTVSGDKVELALVDIAADGDNRSHNSTSELIGEVESGAAPSITQPACGSNEEAGSFGESSGSVGSAISSSIADLSTEVEYNSDPICGDNPSLTGDKVELALVDIAADGDNRSHNSTSELIGEVESGAAPSITQPTCGSNEEAGSFGESSGSVGSAISSSIADLSTEVEYNSDPICGDNPSLTGDKVELALVDIAADGDNRSHNSTSELIGEFESGAAPSITQPACGSNEEAGSFGESSGSNGSAISTSMEHLFSEFQVSLPRRNSLSEEFRSSVQALSAVVSGFSARATIMASQEQAAAHLANVQDGSTMTDCECRCQCSGAQRSSQQENKSSQTEWSEDAAGEDKAVQTEED